MNDPTVLELRDVHRSFRRQGVEYPVLRGVSLQVNRHTVLGIRGSSGAGKTTLARILVGLDTDFKGSRFVAPRVHPRGVQMVFQDSLQAFNPRLPVGISLREACMAAPGGRWTDGLSRKTRRMLHEAMDAVALDAALLDRRPGLLSGGQRQRAAIARALLVQPDVLILDEPVAALDLSVQARVLNVLMDLRLQKRVAMVVISHDDGVLHHLCDEIQELQGGRL